MRKIKFISKIFGDWGFGYERISLVFSNYLLISKDFTETGGTFVRSIDNGASIAETFYSCMIKHGISNDASSLNPGLFASFIDHIGYTTNVLATAETSIFPSVKIPLLISGNVDVGDTILLSNVHDPTSRRLGIIVDKSCRRKGVCMLPGRELSTCGKQIVILYNFHEAMEYTFQM